MNVMIILLGCQVPFLLEDRVQTAVQFIQQHSSTIQTATWFLSGGVKQPAEPNAISEADKMRAYLETYTVGVPSQYILDTQSTNTAENFFRASLYLNHTEPNVYDEIYIVTSKFHQTRAEKMMYLIDASREFQWILGEKQESSSAYWERIHLQNIHKDIDQVMRTFHGHLRP